VSSSPPPFDAALQTTHDVSTTRRSSEAHALGISGESAILPVAVDTVVHGASGRGWNPWLR
jgi:hypothetical protein